MMGNNKNILDDLHIKYDEIYVSKEELLEIITENFKVINLTDKNIVIIFIEDDNENFKEINKNDMLYYINNNYMPYVPNYDIKAK